MADPKPVPTTELELLQAIDAGNVGYYRTKSYRFWTTEDTYQVMTKDVRLLIEAGYAYREPGWRPGLGPVVLTKEGREALAKIEPEA